MQRCTGSRRPPWRPMGKTWAPVPSACRRGNASGRGGGFFSPSPNSIPEEYRHTLGRISDDKTMPQLKKFVESGGSILTIGSSTSIAEVFGMPVKNYLTEKGTDGVER